MWGPPGSGSETPANNRNGATKQNGGKMDVASWWQKRELGFSPGKINTALSQAAEDSFVSKETLHERLCEVPGTPRSTFLIVFSPDGTKVASTHGNHDVYISELSSGKHLKILSGHPRTPWCVTFHPSHTQVLASGCLGGQVRVWDLTGGSEIWHVKGTSVASIAFHPRDHLLVIAASNELHFWDWSQPQPFRCVKTNNISSKIRFVAFDSLGHKLITGISCWSQNTASSNNVLELLPYLPSDNPSIPSNAVTSAREQLPPSYHNLIQRYDNLVRNYHRIIMSRSHSSITIDRGTDPMETDWNSPSDASHSSSSNLPQRTVTTNSFTQTNSHDTRRTRTNNAPFESSIYNIFQGRPSNPRSSDPQPSSSNGTNTTSANREQSRIQSADFTEENINYNILHEVTRNMPPVSSQPQTSSSTRSMKAAYLNRLQNVLEIFIDQTLHSWERCDTNCFLPISAVGNPRNNAQRNFLDNLILPEENEANSSSSNTNEANSSSSNANQPQTSSNPLQRNSRINFNRNPTPDTTESNQNNDGNASLESRNLTDIHSMLRNSGDILINSIRTLRCFNNRLRIYRNRIRGNSSESQAEPETTSNNETFDRERIDEYINQRNANNPSNRNSEQPEQLSTSRDSGNIEMSDGNSESERLNVIDNRLGNSDDVSMDSSTTSFKKRLNVMQNDRIEEPIFDTSNPPNDNMNVEPSDNLPSEPSDSNIPQCSENTTNESDTKTTGSTVPENSSQNLPSCSREGTSDNSTHQAPDGDKNVPSTSGYRSSSVRNNRRIPKVHSINIVTDAFNRVVRGVNLIVTRNQELLNLWTRVLSTRSDPSMSSVRNIWEGLRNDIVQLQINVTQRQLPNNVPPTPARNNACDGNTSNAPTRSDGSNNDTSVRHKRTLSNISKNKSTQSSYSRMHPSNKKIGKRRTKSASSILSQSLNTSNRNLNNPSTSQTNRLLSLNENVSTASTSIEARPFKIKESPTRRSNGPFRRVLRPQLNTQRRGPLSRRAELEVTRDLIRIRARRIVTTMFDIMMYCLDSNQLHNQLVILVKTLKKALTVTCLLLMVNLFSTESPTQSSARNNNAAQDSNSSQPNASIPNRRSNNIPNNNVPNQTRDNANNPVNGSNNSSTLRRESGSSAHIRRIRNHPTFYVRRRMSLPSRNIQQLLSDNNSSQPISPNSLSRPSTSREQEFDPSEGTEPPSDSSRNTSSTPRPQPTRTRLMQTLRPNLFRSHLSRPCFFRRLLCSQGFLNDTLRQANQPVRLEPNSRESTGLRTLLSRLYNSSRRVRGGNPEDRAANNVSVPVVQVNDVPIDMQNADPPHAVYAARVFDHRQPEFQNIFSMEDIIYDNRWTATIRFSSEPTQTYRIQAWDFTNGELPDISDINKNIVVRECKIHNDANIDISRDGRLLVALLLTHRIGSTLNVLGIFSLEWHNLGVCLYTTYMEQNAVSVSLSPCARHLAVGLGSKRVSLVPYGQNGVMAIIFRLDQSKDKSKDKAQSPKPLQPIRRLEHNFQDSGFTSMNCLKWAPQPGQGLVYANSIGQLKILS